MTMPQGQSRGQPSGSRVAGVRCLWPDKKSRGIRGRRHKDRIKTAAPEASEPVGHGKKVLAANRRSLLHGREFPTPTPFYGGSSVFPPAGGGYGLNDRPTERDR